MRHSGSQQVTNGSVGQTNCTSIPKGRPNAIAQKPDDAPKETQSSKGEA